jgi:small-conductance mechanosensitive channel
LAFIKDEKPILREKSLQEINITLKILIVNILFLFTIVAIRAAWQVCLMLIVYFSNLRLIGVDNDHAMILIWQQRKKSLTGWALRRAASLTPRGLGKTHWPLK